VQSDYVEFDNQHCAYRKFTKSALIRDGKENYPTLSVYGLSQPGQLPAYGYSIDRSVLGPRLAPEMRRREGNAFKN